MVGCRDRRDVVRGRPSREWRCFRVEARRNALVEWRSDARVESCRDGRSSRVLTPASSRVLTPAPSPALTPAPSPALTRARSAKKSTSLQDTSPLELVALKKTADSLFGAQQYERALPILRRVVQGDENDPSITTKLYG